MTDFLPTVRKTLIIRECEAQTGPLTLYSITNPRNHPTVHNQNSKRSVKVSNLDSFTPAMEGSQAEMTPKRRKWQCGRVEAMRFCDARFTFFLLVPQLCLCLSTPINTTLEGSFLVRTGKITKN